MFAVFSFLFILCSLDIYSKDPLDKTEDFSSDVLINDNDDSNGDDSLYNDKKNTNYNDDLDVYNEINTPNDSYNNADNTTFSNNINIEDNEKLKKEKKDGSVFYKGTSVSFSDIDKNLLILSGDAEIKSGGYSISGDTIIFNTQNNVVESKWYRKDNIFNKLNKKSKRRIKIINKNGDTIFCDGMKYNIDSNRGVLKNVLLYKNDVIILSKYCKIDYDGTYYCKHLSLTSCKAKRPDWAVLVDKAIVNKNNLIFLYGARLMFLGTYFPVIRNVGIPILIPERYKSGLKYPESVNFSNDGGLAIRNFGFYIYISKYRDLNCNITMYLGNNSVGFSLIHNYILTGKFSGRIAFGLDKMSLYNINTEMLEMFKTNWNFIWKQSTLNYENYEFNIDVNLSGTKSDANIKNDNEKKMNLEFNVKAREVIFKKFSFSLGNKYFKDLEKNIEEIELLYLNLNSKQFKPLKFLTTSVVLNTTSNVSNVKKNLYLKDDHDVNLKDDIFNEDFIITMKNIKDLFDDFTLNNILNKLKKISSEAKINVPVLLSKKFLDNYNLSLVINYDSRVFFSKYNVNKKEVEFRKLPYYVHNISIGTHFDFKIESLPMNFDEFHHLNIYKIKELKWLIDPHISFTYSPECNKFQKLFLLSDAYKKENKKTLNLFYHTKFGNVNDSESALVSLNLKNTLVGKKNVKGKIDKFNIFDLNIGLGYNFLKEKCKMSDIDVSTNFNIYKFNISLSSKFFPYYYEDNKNYTEDNKEDKRIKVDKLFLEREDVNKWKAFVESIMSSSINVGIQLFQNNTNNKQKEKKLEDYLELDERRYADFYLWDNLNMSLNYSFNYVFNPIRQEKDITQTMSLSSSTLLTKNCNVNCSVVYNIKDELFQSFNFSGKYDLHCWTLSFNIGVSSDKLGDRSLSYNVSITPKNELFSPIGQTRSDNFKI